MILGEFTPAQLVLGWELTKPLESRLMGVWGFRAALRVSPKIWKIQYLETYIFEVNNNSAVCSLKMNHGVFL